MLFSEFKEFSLLWSSVITDEALLLDLKPRINLVSRDLLQSGTNTPKEPLDMSSIPYIAPTYTIYEVFYDPIMEKKVFKDFENLKRRVSELINKIESELPFYSCRSDDYLSVYTKSKLDRIHINGKKAAEIFKDLLLADKIDFDRSLNRVSSKTLNKFINLHDFGALGTLQQAIYYAIELNEWDYAYTMGAFDKKTWSEKETDKFKGLSPVELDSLVQQLIYSSCCSDYTLYQLSQDFRPFKVFQEYMLEKIDILTEGDSKIREDFAKIQKLPNGIHLVNSNLAISLLVNLDNHLSSFIKTRLANFLEFLPAK